MDQDSEACKQSDTMFIVWMRHLKKFKNEQLAAKLACQHYHGEPIDAVHHSQGSFNRCYRVKFRDGTDVLVRFPALGRSMFRREKLQDEIAVMEYLSRNTSIPIPQVLGHGTSAVGPYVVLEFVEGKSLSDYLRASHDPMMPSTLNPNIDIAILRQAYLTMAEILLQLSRCRFPAIGGLVKTDSWKWDIDKRAMTFNMNELVGLGNFPPKMLSQSTFQTANAYFLSLADDHLHHLETQRNDAVADEADCRKKYVARCLFRQIARQFSTAYNNGPFILFCDDLRPSNILVDAELNLRSVIDWEFCYAAPVEFFHCSPWWLLLARPEIWDAGFDDFVAHYIPRQKIFLEILRDREQALVESGIVLESPRLSEHMSQSLENGNFWFFLAATYSWAFDEIYWQFIHPKYYGQLDSIEDLVKLLSLDEQSRIGTFVGDKLKQSKEGGLDSHRTLQEMMDA
ncbi:hypothetical protein PRK78_005741 [Emydomyces testavorans]|uniref:Aminoglycoside phosphotransferase domain-containing protein n=1 Tax=Emydomyces testavorans TaxID=2070801 RepID=A0AAF0DK58_9EURO|nr:hypothetical protein PRK78_005741 [Emydomyces testavorans]